MRARTAYLVAGYTGVHMYTLASVKRLAHLLMVVLGRCMQRGFGKARLRIGRFGSFAEGFTGGVGVLPA
jgi:hypothetical protein